MTDRLIVIRGYIKLKAYPKSNLNEIKPQGLVK